jgi:hypothetical protein
MPLELKLRGKSTTMSYGTPIYYVDLVVRTGITLEQAITQARELDEQRQASGFDQAALDEAARKGFANGAFEDLAEDVQAVVEEFYPEAEQVVRTDGVNEGASSLRGRLDARVASAGAG